MSKSYNMRRRIGPGRASFISFTLKPDGEPWRLLDVACDLIPEHGREQIKATLANLGIKPETAVLNLNIGDEVFKQSVEVRLRFIKGLVS